MFCKVFPRNFLQPCRCRLLVVGVVIMVIVFIYHKAKLNHVNKYITEQNLETNIDVSKPENKKDPDNIIISDLIYTFNNNKEILNSDIFGAIKEDTIILVILLDKFSSGFRYFLASLSEVTGIEEALVVFSHSYYDESIHKEISEIDFCRVLQIYYPYSVQTHPYSFPGYDRNDCTQDWFFKLIKSNCSYTLFPEFRSQARDPTKAEKKHHWWWTANIIFENLSITAKHTGLVMFSEDDFIFMKDFIYMALYMKDVADSLPQCEFISLGSATSPLKESRNFYGVDITSWDPQIHSSIIGFSSATWNSIVAHYDLFCTVDDTSWSHSLNYVSVNRRDGMRFKTISAVTPRAYKIDSCGTDFRSLFGFGRCDLSQNVLRVINLEAFNKWNLFPPHLELYINIELEDEEDVVFDYSTSDEGWDDPRDWALCRNMTAGKMKKILMDMKNEFHEYLTVKS